MPLFNDRVLETSTTTGTGTFTISGTGLTGYGSWASQHAVGNIVYYVIEAVDANNTPNGAFETGIGVFLTSTTFSRGIVVHSSNADALVSFGAGTKLCFTAPHSKWFEDESYAHRSIVLGVAGSASVGTLGIGFTATGTATGVAPAITNALTRAPRTEYLVTAASTTAVAGFRNTTTYVLRGNAAGVGGFRYLCRWGNASGGTVATTRAFVGLSSNAAAPTDVEPNTQINIVGMGWGAADANLQLYHNDAAGVAVATDLGANFVVPNTDRSALYEIELWCPPNVTYINYIIRNLVNNAVLMGQITSADIPLNTTYLSPRGYISVGGTSSIIGIAIVKQELFSN